MRISYDFYETKGVKASAVALGFFDGLHAGHRKVIEAAVTEKANGLTACVFTFTLGGERPQSKEGAHLLQTESLKERYMEEAGVDFYFSPQFDQFKSLSPRDFVDALREKLGAKVLCCGENFRFGAGAKGDIHLLGELCDEFGIRLVQVPSVCLLGEVVSSTRIRTLIEGGQVKEAGILLGRLFGYDFPVTTGRQLGRTMNFPTINQLIPQNFILPRFGVYSSITHLEGAFYPSVTNIGVCPTVGGKKPQSETHILSYEGDLYGKQVQVDLVDFIRPEQKFPNIKVLQEQIARDSETARQAVLAYFEVYNGKKL